MSDLVESGTAEPITWVMSVRRFFQRHGTALISITLLVIAHSVLRARRVDVQFEDETNYLESGLHFLGSLPRGPWGPLYSAWYWIESFVVRDPLQLYYANWSALVWCFLTAGLLVLRGVGASSLMTVAIVGWLGSSHLIEQWPYISLLAATLVAAGVGVAVRMRDISGGLAVGAAFFGLAAFVRPELATAFAVALGAAVLSTILERRTARPALLVVPVLAFGIPALLFGNPLGGERSFIAFSQHFARNVVWSRRLDIDPWLNSGRIAREFFGPAETVGDAWRANPQAFAWHIGENAKAMVGQVKLLASTLLPWDAVSYGVGAAILAGACLALGSSWIDRRESSAPTRTLTSCVLAGAVLVPTVASSLLVYPRSHYLMASVFPLVAVSCTGWTRLWHRFGLFAWSKRKESWATAAVGVAVVAGVVVMPTYAGPDDAFHRTNLATVEYLRRLPHPAGEVVILEPDHGRLAYAGWKYQQVSPADCEPFGACLQAKHPDLVIVDGRLDRYYARAGDFTFLSALTNPGAVGMTRVWIADAEVYLLVRSSLASELGLR